MGPLERAVLGQDIVETMKSDIHLSCKYVEIQSLFHREHSESMLEVSTGSILFRELIDNCEI